MTNFSRGQSIPMLQAIAHDIAVKHGWWERPRPFLEMIVLIHSELSEAVEAYRDAGDIHKVWFTIEGGKKPEGVPSELADVLIRLLDLCEAYDIDLERAMLSKMAYNETREYKHGGKAA